ncbi:MAG: S1 family peptidase [bacterium]
MLLFLAGPALAKTAGNIVDENMEAIRPLSFTVNVSMSNPQMPMQQGNEQEIRHHTAGVLVDSKNLLVSTSELKGPMGPSIPMLEQQGWEVNTTTSNFEVELADSSVNARLAARDSRRGVAIIQLEEEVQAVDSIDLKTGQEELDYGEEVLLLNRFGEELNYKPRIYYTNVSGIIDNPRRMYGLMNLQEIHTGYVGSPAYDEEGNLVGIVLLRSVGDNTSNTSGSPMMPNMRAMVQAMQPFVLPAGEIAEVVDNL